MDAAMTQAELRTARERIVQEHIYAEKRHDVAATLTTFAEPNYDVVALEQRSEGAQAVTDLLSDLFAAFPDFDVETVAQHHADEVVFVEGFVTGTHTGPLRGLPQTGRSVRYRVGCVFRFDGTRLIEEALYFDNATLLRQLGLLPQQGSRGERAMMALAGLGIRAGRLFSRRTTRTIR